MKLESTNLGSGSNEGIGSPHPHVAVQRYFRDIEDNDLSAPDHLASFRHLGLDVGLSWGNLLEIERVVVLGASAGHD